MTKTQVRVILFAFLVVLLFAQNSKRRDLGPYAWDDEIMVQLRVLSAEHKVMQAQITTNTEHLKSIDRRQDAHESIQTNDRLSERVAVVEAEFKLVIAIGLATLGSIIGFFGWAYRNARHVRKLIRNNNEDQKDVQV